MSDPVEQVRAWLVDEVIGFDLCPFARGPWKRGSVALTRCDAADVDEALEAVTHELLALAERTEAERSTTLVVLPGFAPSWESFREVIGGTELLLEEAGLTELFQVVGFHPAAVYENAQADDPANAAARAPVPVVHLLRADMVARAIVDHPDAAGISEDNARRLRERAGRERDPGTGGA